MNFCLILSEVEHLSHLTFGFPACAGISHRQAGRDAVRREEQVARAGFELSIKLQSEGCVAINHSCDLRRVCGVRAEQNYQSGGNEAEDGGDFTHGDLPSTNPS